eukprot:159267-Hanusia_phi.AAC.1
MYPEAPSQRLWHRCSLRVPDLFPTVGHGTSNSKVTTVALRSDSGVSGNSDRTAPDSGDPGTAPGCRRSAAAPSDPVANAGSSESTSSGEVR